MRNAEGFLSITATVWSPDSSRAASSEPTRPQPMITTCTGTFLFGFVLASYRVLTRSLRRGTAALTGSLRRRCRVGDVSTRPQPDLEPPPPAPATPPRP